MLDDHREDAGKVAVREKMMTPKPKKRSGRSQLKLFVGLYLLSRALMLVIPGWLWDLQQYALGGDLLRQGVNPYEYLSGDTQGAHTNRYPPLWLAHIYLVTILGYTPVAVKFGVLLHEVVLMAGLYYLIKEMHPDNPQERARQVQTSLYLYAFFPLTILVGIGFFEVIPVMYMVLGFLFYYRDRWVLTGVFFTLGFLTEVFPIFCLVPILFHLFWQKKWKRIAAVIGAVLLTAVLVSLPLILLDPTRFLESYTVHFSRYPQVLTLWQLLQEHIPWDLFSVFGLITVSPVGLSFLILFSTYAILTFVYFWKHPKAGKHEVVVCAMLFLFFFPFCFLSLHFRYYFWVFPLAVLFSSNEGTSRRLQHLAYASIAILAAFMIVAVSTFPDLVFVDLRAAPIGLPTWRFFFVILAGVIIFVFILAWGRLGARVKFKRLESKTPSFLQFLLIPQASFVGQVFVIIGFWDEIWGVVLMGGFLLAVGSLNVTYSKWIVEAHLLGKYMPSLF